LHMHVNHYVALQWVTYKPPAQANDQDGVDIRLESQDGRIVWRAQQAGATTLTLSNNEHAPNAADSAPNTRDSPAALTRT
jgi:hypothetical protein